MGEKSRAVRRDPRQGRSKFLVDAILSAASSLVVKAGWSNVTTNKIAKLAGVSIGSLYQYFPNKDAIYVKLLFQVEDGYKQRIISAIEELEHRPVGEKILHILDVVVEGMLENRELLRALHDHALKKELLVQIKSNRDDVERRLAGLLSKHIGDIEPDDPDMAAFMIINSVMGSVRNRIAHEETDPSRIPSMKKEVYRLVTGYLFGSTKVPDDPVIRDILHQTDVPAPPAPQA